MSYATYIPHVTPVQFVPLGITEPAQYNVTDLDNSWFREQIAGLWVNQKDYYQKWQNNDIIAIQFQSNGLSPAQVQIMDSNGYNVGAPIAINTKSSPYVRSPMILFQGNVPVSGLSEGVYYFLLTVGTGGTVTQYISEPQYIKAKHENTFLFEYSHSVNKQAVKFDPTGDGTQNYTPSFRVEAWWSDFLPDAVFFQYTDQVQDIEMINGFPYRTRKLNIGLGDGIPDWVIDKINRILLLDTVKINGIGYTRNGDAKFEAQSANGNPKHWYSIDMRQARNRDGVTVTTDGQIDESISILYNINVKAFGQGDTTVQVTKID